MSGKFVLDGGPCTGKTTTLRALAVEGFQVLPEAARMIIDEKIAFPWDDIESFNKELLKRQLLLESNIKKPVAFCDRGVPSIIAYSEVFGFKVPQEIFKVLESNRYNKIFLLEPLGFYEQDEARKEDPETARKIHASIRKAYVEQGYEVISVPPLSVEKRVAFIKKHIL